MCLKCANVSAPVNLPQPKPLLSWLTNMPVSGANCGLAAKFKTWLFHVSARPSAFSFQCFILNFRHWLVFSGKWLLEMSSAAYLQVRLCCLQAQDLVKPMPAPLHGGLIPARPAGPSSGHRAWGQQGKCHPLIRCLEFTEIAFFPPE